MTTSTRFIGTCPVCVREVKCRDGKLVHHGYNRPGNGYIEGDCFGVHYEPHETSSKCAEEYRTFLAGVLDAKLEELQRAPGKTEIFIMQGYPKKMVQITKEDKSFDRELKSYIRGLEAAIEGLRSETQRTDRLIATWEAKPLRTVEEEVAQKQEAQDQRVMARREKGMANIAAEVAKYQKRLTSAARNRTASVFIQIFENAPSKLNDVGGALIEMSRKEAYERIGNVEVWKKLGLLDAEGNPVYASKTGRFTSYGIPYDVQPKVVEAIKEGVLGNVSWT